MRALAWEFPNDISLRETDTQFMLGPSLLVTPVLEANVTTVKGVFPGIDQGTRWYDWCTLQEVTGVRPHENVTMMAPLEHINLHIRGGSIMPLQDPGNTTAATARGPYSLLVALDKHDRAVGSLYLDDGESLEPNETSIVEVSRLYLILESALNKPLTLCVKFSYVAGHLTARAWGNFHAAVPLANITILGLQQEPSHIALEVDRYSITGLQTEYSEKTLRLSGLESATEAGVWQSGLTLRFS